MGFRKEYLIISLLFLSFLVYLGTRLEVDILFSKSHANISRKMENDPSTLPNENVHNDEKETGMKTNKFNLSDPFSAIKFWQDNKKIIPELSIAEHLKNDRIILGFYEELFKFMSIGKKIEYNCR